MYLFKKDVCGCADDLQWDCLTLVVTRAASSGFWIIRIKTNVDSFHTNDACNHVITKFLTNLNKNYFFGNYFVAFRISSVASIRQHILPKSRKLTAQKLKFSIKDFFSEYDQIHWRLQIWSHLLKKFLMETFTFYAVILTKH